MLTREILSSHPVTTLRKEIAKTNIKGYSSMKKPDIIELMMKHKDRFDHIQMKVKSAPAKKSAPPAKKPSGSLKERQFKKMEKAIADIAEGKDRNEVMSSFEDAVSVLKDEKLLEGVKDKLMLRKLQAEFKRAETKAKPERTVSFDVPDVSERVKRTRDVNPMKKGIVNDIMMKIVEIEKKAKSSRSKGTLEKLGYELRSVRRMIGQAIRGSKKLSKKDQDIVSTYPARVEKLSEMIDNKITKSKK